MQRHHDRHGRHHDHTQADSLGFCRLDLTGTLATAITNRAIDQFRFYQQTATTPGIVLEDDDIITECQITEGANPALVTQGLHTVVLMTVGHFARRLTQRPIAKEHEDLIKRHLVFHRRMTTAGNLGYTHLGSDVTRYLVDDLTAVPNLALRQALTNVTQAVILDLNWTRTPDGSAIVDVMTARLVDMFYENAGIMHALRGMRVWTTNPAMQVMAGDDQLLAPERADATRPLAPVGVG